MTRHLFFFSNKLGWTINFFLNYMLARVGLFLIGLGASHVQHDFISFFLSSFFFILMGFLYVFLNNFYNF